MHATVRSALRAGAAAIAICTAPTVVAAQQPVPLDPVRVTAESRAERYEAEAAALPTMTKEFKKAAGLYELAAEARSPQNAARATNLRQAAYHRYYAGDTRAGGRLMERAAQQSAATGDVALAANAYIDAALIANEREEIDRALDLGRKAELLINSPLLDEAQRAGLLGRIAGWHQVAMAPRQK
jgi:hypothetical protein